MSKEEIMGVLMKHLQATVPEIDTSKIKSSQSMTEVGANSLDIVETVSATMRELKVKIPREDLANLNDVGALVDAIHAQLN